MHYTWHTCSRRIPLTKIYKKKSNSRYGAHTMLRTPDLHCIYCHYSQIVCAGDSQRFCLRTRRNKCRQSSLGRSPHWGSMVSRYDIYLRVPFFSWGYKSAPGSLFVGQDVGLADNDKRTAPAVLTAGPPLILTPPGTHLSCKVQMK